MSELLQAGRAGASVQCLSRLHPVFVRFHASPCCLHLFSIVTRLGLETVLSPSRLVSSISVRPSPFLICSVTFPPPSRWPFATRPHLVYIPSPSSLRLHISFLHLRRPPSPSTPVFKPSVSCRSRLSDGRHGSDSQTAQTGRFNWLRVGQLRGRYLHRSRPGSPPSRD